MSGERIFSSAGIGFIEVINSKRKCGKTITIAGNKEKNKKRERKEKVDFPLGH